MTIRTIIIAFILTFSKNNLCGQILDTTYLINIFSQNAKENSMNNTWHACNKESSFLKSDTLELYNDANKISNCNYFYHLSWKFIDRTHLESGSVDNSSEPPGVLVYFHNENLFEIEYFQKKDYVGLYIFQNKLLITKYKVASIDKLPSKSYSDNSFKLTLIKSK